MPFLVLGPNAVACAKLSDRLTAAARARKWHLRIPPEPVVAIESEISRLARGGQSSSSSPHSRRLYAREINRMGVAQIFVSVPGDSADELQRHERALEDLAVGHDGICYLGKINPAMLDDADLDFYLDVWRMHVDRARYLAELAPEGWGYPWARVVLVGDQVPDGVARPFGQTEEPSASSALSGLLDIAGLGERQVWIVNAREKNGELLERAPLELLKPGVVVALGRVAAARLRAIGWDGFVEFPHPQYLRRFHLDQLEVWGEKLRQLTAPAVAGDGRKTGPPE